MSDILTAAFPLEECARQVAACLNTPGSVALVPTETVYGLGANALDELASAKIYEAKGNKKREIRKLLDNQIIGILVPYETEVFNPEIRRIKRISYL